MAKKYIHSLQFVLQFKSLIRRIDPLEACAKRWALTVQQTGLFCCHINLILHSQVMVKLGKKKKKNLPCPVSKETFAGIGVCLLSWQPARRGGGYQRIRRGWTWADVETTKTRRGCGRCQLRPWWYHCCWKTWPSSHRANGVTSRGHGNTMCQYSQTKERLQVVILKQSTALYFRF